MISVANLPMADLRRWAAGLLAVASLSSGCDCGGERVKTANNLTVTITSPEAGATLLRDETTAFSATAQNPSGVESVTLLAGELQVGSCVPADGADDARLDCQTQLRTLDVASQVSNGTLTLTARANGRGGELAEASIQVSVRPLRVRFVTPRGSVAGQPQRVTSPSDLELAVEALVPVELVQLSVDSADTAPIRRFRAPPYKDTINWAQEVGTGPKRLVAQARDRDGTVDTASINVLFVCRNDGECGTGNRCCVEDGLCHPIVGRGADCDCQHPCPLDQGCFPGVCGELPRKCRPGCFPGNNDTKADRCGDQDGKISFCSSLPASERTAQNKGGGCAVADRCDVVRQDCPNLPLRRDEPLGRTNANVPHSCVPVSPVANACLPAGNIPLGGTNCEYDTCGDDSKACQRGLVCVTQVDQNNRPVGPSRCEKQCRDPADPLSSLFGAPRSVDCGAGEFCGQVMGSGRELFRTGTCQSAF